MKPKRIQLKRTKGWRLPANTVKVDRSTRWGNPHKIHVLPDDIDPLTLQMDCQHGICYSAEAAVNRFRRSLNTGLPLATNERRGWHITLADIKRELRGKNLACWCKLGQPCHADVLLEIANA
ncbi:MAG: DUF4326 domain-containing protein [Verrucomicrobiota bacterium]